MTRKKVIPVDGKSIPMHDGNGNLPETGKTLTLNSYWHRREADKDVTFEEPEEDSAPAPDGAPAADGAGTRTKK